MCGIAGVINPRDINLNTMMMALKHRGPDEQAIFTDDNIALIQTRLAIQDIKNGTQPLHYQHFSIVFNGEIYNHLALRKHLTQVHFQTTSDTETLLHLYIKYREKMFEMLDGMFAFCIYDKKNKLFFLARDRAGKKPLYYLQNHQSFLFASELNTLKKITKLNLNHDALSTYLRTGFIWQSYTIYQDVFELDAGSYLTVDTQSLRQEIKSYFNILDYYESPPSCLSFADNLAQVEERLRESVADRLLASDVEVGVFLSGGIDSNLIAALAAKTIPKIKTFTVKFSDAYDESPLALLTAQKYNTDHTTLSIQQNLRQDVEQIILAYGEPFMDSSAIPSYYVSREARKHVKVVLSGDGADELFAGYRRYVPATHNLMTYFKLLAPFLKLLPNANNKKSIYNYFYRLIAMSAKKNLDFYLSATTDIFEDILTIQPNSILSQMNEFIKKSFANKKLTSLKKFLYLDFSIILFCDLLVKMDIASMANSLEVRSPFLAKRLLEFVPTLPDKHKINGIHTKYILRKLAEKLLPEQLINQPKRGFEVPLKKWLDEDLYENVHDALQPGNFAENYIDRHFIQKLLSKKINVAAEKRAKMLWTLYCLEVWHKNETKNFNIG